MEKPKQLQYSRLEELLEGIEKPGRYVDHEIGVSSKDPEDLGPGDTLVALAFPDLYEVGVPNLGIQILYEIINSQPTFSAERVFAPWIDLEERLRETGTRLFSLENRIFLDSFDLIGFSLQHELLYSNVLNMLDMGGIDPVASNRPPRAPIVCAGGPAMVNPAPMSRFMDFVLIGEAEEVMVPLLEMLARYRREGPGRESFLDEVSGFEGIYVPSRYKYFYSPGGGIEKIEPPVKVRKAVVSDPDSIMTVTRPVIPNIQPVHDRYAVEIMRGCGRGCRFCQAGFIYRPVRSKKPERLVEESLEGLKNTGYDEISFLSLSTSDYRGLDRLLKGIRDRSGTAQLSISLPSMRFDSFTVDMADQVLQGRKTGLTFAPEAGSQRMRDIINKNISEDEIMDCIDTAFSRGWEKIKLYFMLGFPGETDQDALETAGLIKRIAFRARDAMPRNRKKRFNMNVSINVFNPKPFTPFQWVSQEDKSVLEHRLEIILDSVRQRYINISWSDPERSRIECALSRGDTRLGKVIEDAWKRGARFDNWTDLFDAEAWTGSFEANNIEMGFFTGRTYDTAEILPWDVVDMGIRKETLISEYGRALEYMETGG